MLPQKIFKIRIFNLAEIEFQTTKFPDFSRFSKSVATLSQNLRYESLVITDYDCVKSSSLTVLCIKLWLKKMVIKFTHKSPSIFVQIYSVEGAKYMKMLSSFGHTFLADPRE